MRIILRLAFLFMAASILNANAGQIGPPEGGPCDGCSVWIDSTTLDGGQINSSLRSSMLDGSRSYAPETEALAHANCHGGCVIFGWTGRRKHSLAVKLIFSWKVNLQRAVKYQRQDELILMLKT